MNQLSNSTASGEDSAARETLAVQYVLPNFKYIAARGATRTCGTINIGSVIFHHGKHLDEFHAALGFKQGEKTRLLPDEFIWDRYTRAGAPKSQQCLQVQIATYLHNHSADFRRLYGRGYDELKGCCISDDIDNGDWHCFKCTMHPRGAN